MQLSFAAVLQVRLEIIPIDDLPVAEDLHVTVYSGKSTVFDLPTYDPEGNNLEIYIMTEPQGTTEILRLTGEQFVSIGGQRRKVRREPCGEGR